MECVTVTIKTLSPVVLTAMNNAAVMTESRNFINGTVLRGILAARFIENKKLEREAHKDKEFRELFFSELRFIDANPVQGGKRAFVIPFSLDAGSKLIVVTDEDNILLKPVIAPDLREFDALINESQRWASD